MTPGKFDNLWLPLEIAYYAVMGALFFGGTNAPFALGFCAFCLFVIMRMLRKPESFKKPL